MLQLQTWHNNATTNNATSRQRACQYGLQNSVSFVLMTAFSLSDIEPTRSCTVVKEIDLQDFRRRRSSTVSVCGFGLA